MPYVFKAAQAVIKWFGKKRTKTIDKEIKGNGFRYYSLNAEINRNFGINPGYFKNYVNWLSGKLTNSKPNHIDQVKAALLVSEFAPFNEWKLADTNIDI